MSVDLCDSPYLLRIWMHVEPHCWRSYPYTNINIDLFLPYFYFDFKVSSVSLVINIGRLFTLSLSHFSFGFSAFSSVYVRELMHPHNESNTSKKKKHWLAKSEANSLFQCIQWECININVLLSCWAPNEVLLYQCQWICALHIHLLPVWLFCTLLTFTFGITCLHFVFLLLSFHRSSLFFCCCLAVVIVMVNRQIQW